MTATAPEGGATLTFTLQRVEGVTPPIQLLAILETPTALDIKAGNGVVLLLDNNRVPLKGVCQSPIRHAGGFTEVGLCFLTNAELDRICAAKNLRVSMEGKASRLGFRIPRPDGQFKNFHEAVMEKK